MMATWKIEGECTDRLAKDCKITIPVPFIPVCNFEIAVDVLPSIGDHVLVLDDDPQIEPRFYTIRRLIRKISDNDGSNIAYESLCEECQGGD